MIFLGALMWAAMVAVKLNSAVTNANVWRATEQNNIVQEAIGEEGRFTNEVSVYQWGEIFENTGRVALYNEC